MIIGTLGETAVCDDRGLTSSGAVLDGALDASLDGSSAEHDA